MQILVIGGTGFIGSRVVEKLCAEGHSPVIMARKEKIFPPEVTEKIAFATGDIRMISDITRVIADYKIERIINAAYMLTSEGEANPYMASLVNNQGTCNIFEASRLFGIKRVVFCSSIAAYASQIYYGDRLVTEEEDLMKPASIYGSAKVFNEFIATRFQNKYEIEIPVVRISAVYGSGREARGVTAWTSQIVSSALKGEPAVINMRENQLANFIYVDDSAEQLVRICIANNIQHNIYNSGGITFTPKDFGDIVKKHFPNVNIMFNNEAPEWPYPYRIDGSRIEEEIGVQVRRPEEAILDQIDYEKKILQGL